MKTANFSPVRAKRTSVTLHPDRTRVLIRPFNVASGERAGKICAQVMALSDREVHALVEQVQAEFGERHLKIREFLKRRFELVRHSLRAGRKVSEERQLLLGVCSRTISISGTARSLF